jgi:hypothetical protein
VDGSAGGKDGEGKEVQAVAQPDTSKAATPKRQERLAIAVRLTQ